MLGVCCFLWIARCARLTDTSGASLYCPTLLPCCLIPRFSPACVCLVALQEQVKLLPGSPDGHHHPHDLEHGMFTQAARKHRELGMVALY